MSLDVAPRTIMAVLGRNGAGKTSFLRGLAGFRLAEGVSVDGDAYLGTTRLPRRPRGVNRAGVVFVPERSKVFPSLTVADHLKLVGLTSIDQLAPLDFDGLRSRWRSRAGMLSGGERQMLALAVAWAQRPRLLLVDELSLGLAPIIVQRLLASLRQMIEVSDMAVVIVEQDAVAALKVADRVMVLDHGESVMESRSEDTDARAISSHFLGLSE